MLNLTQSWLLRTYGSEFGGGLEDEETKFVPICVNSRCYWTFLIGKYFDTTVLGMSATIIVIPQAHGGLFLLKSKFRQSQVRSKSKVAIASSPYKPAGSIYLSILTIDGL